MRSKLIKVLRLLEQSSGFKNEYTEFIEQYECDYLIEEHLDFPNFRSIIKSFNDKHALTIKQGLVSLVSSNSVRAELKRMEADELVMIGVQDGVKYGTAPSSCGPDFDEGIKITSESVVLTTKGKNKKQYFLHKAIENPVNTSLSISAIIISLIALFK